MGDGDVSEAPEVLRRPWSVRRTYVVVLVLYIVGWGYGLASAIASLSEPSRVAGQVGPRSAFVLSSLVLSTDVGVLALVFCVARLRGLTAADLGLRVPDTTAGRWRDVDIVLLFWVALAAAGVAAALLGSRQYPYAQGTWDAVPQLILAVGAGPTEELALLVLPLLLMRQTREPAWRIGLVLVLLRLSFHVYYGVGVIGLVIWATAILALYWRTGRALPLIVAHSLFDTFGTIAHFFPSLAALFGLTILGVGGLCLVRAGVFLTGRTRARHA